MANNNNQNQQLAVLQPPRFAMPANVEKDYDLTPDTWRAVVDAVFPLAKTPGAVLMALAYCKKRNLDVFARVVHIVPIRVGGREVETVWPGIGQLRVTAHRQKDFAGWKECEFGPDKTIEFSGKIAKWEQGRISGYDDVAKQVTFPEWARFTFLKMINGNVFEAVGPKVYWLEEYARLSSYVDVPNDMWAKRPRGQFEKVAEAAAARRGWPDVFGDEATYEEMAGKQNDTIEGEFTEVTDRNRDPGDGAAAVQSQPTRSDFGATPPAEDGSGTAGAEDAEVEEIGAGQTAQDAPNDVQTAGDDQQQGGDDAHVGIEKPDIEIDDTADYSEFGAPPEGLETWQDYGRDIISKFKMANTRKRVMEISRGAGDTAKKAPPQIVEIMTAWFDYAYDSNPA